MAEEKKEKKQEAKKVEVPENLKDIVEKIENMTVKDLSVLVKTLEKKFGVSAAMPMAVAAAPAAGGTAKVTEEEKTEFDVLLKNVGGSKIAVIKLVKEITGKGLKESKDLVDATAKEPQVLKAKVKKEEADELKKKIEAVGAVIELK